MEKLSNKEKAELTWKMLQKQKEKKRKKAKNDCNEFKRDMIEKTMKKRYGQY